MNSFYARIGSPMGGGERVVGITGRTANGLLRIVDVDARGNVIGNQTYIPANVPYTELHLGPDGYLLDGADNEKEEIDWAAHEDKLEYNEEGEAKISGGEMSSVSPTNPALGGFPELQGE
jgi:hypothetical protein